MGYYLGAIPDTKENMVMINGIGGEKPAAALLMPLIVSGRVVMILYVEGGEVDLGERFFELHRLISKAVLAFEILIFREKILMLLAIHFLYNRYWFHGSIVHLYHFHGCLSLFNPDNYKMMNRLSWKQKPHQWSSGTAGNDVGNAVYIFSCIKMDMGKKNAVHFTG